jgi:DNA-binding NarL/FixJ family response regulator/class 3 adenylate cyclase
MSNTTTVVTTDITDSTGLVRSLGDDGYTSVFQAHAAIVRAEVERWGGRVTKQLGDGTLAMFDSAYAGVQAAVSLQQAAERATRCGDAPPLGLRVGINVGEIIESDDGDSFGFSLVLSKRLCDAAEPGQILVSDLVRLLIGGRSDTTFEPAGTLTLKGVAQPVTAFTVPWTPLPEQPALRVVVAEDAALIRSGIVRLLTDAGFNVIAGVGDAEVLLAEVDADPPDLVITDIRMPPTNTDEGLRAASAIRARYPNVAVLVLSQYIEARAAAALLDGRPAGIGYLLKERVSAIDDFVQVCRDVAAGGSVIDPLVTEQLLTSRRHDDALHRLTEREREVLSLMAQGGSNPAIGASLHLGMKTVESHVRSIFQKLDLDQTTDGNRRVQAVLRWLQRSS